MILSSSVSAPGFHQNFTTFQGTTDVGSLLAAVGQAMGKHKIKPESP